MIGEMLWTIKDMWRDGVFGKSLVLLAVASAIALVFCTLTAVHDSIVPIEGRVVGKHFEPAHYSTQMIPVNYGGHTTSFVPLTIHHDDEWIIDVDTGSRVRGASVSKSEFDKIEIGSQFHHWSSP